MVSLAESFTGLIHGSGRGNYDRTAHSTLRACDKVSHLVTGTHSVDVDHTKNTAYNSEMKAALRGNSCEKLM